MPRYRFQWGHLPDRLLYALCREFRLDLGDPVAELCRRFGARPREDFIREAWSVLLAEWLDHNRNARRSVIFDLRGGGFGAVYPAPKGKVAEKRYLRTVRNTRRAREVLLDKFIAAGELVPPRPKRLAPSSSKAMAAVDEEPVRPWHPGYHKGRIPANKGKRYPPEVLTPAEIARLIRACDPTTDRGLRTRAVIAILYRSGLRISECLALMPKDINLTWGTIWVALGKGGRSRTVGIDPTGMGMVQAWMNRRAELGIGRDSPVICTYVKGRRGRPVKPSQIRTTLPAIAREAGIERRVHPHGLRHAHAFELVMEGIQINLVMRQLGHAWLSSTVYYVDHLAPIDVVKAIRTREWNIEVPEPDMSNVVELRKLRAPALEFVGMPPRREE